jgi:hypothetical protein
MSRGRRALFSALLFSAAAGLFAQETRERPLLPFPLKIGGETGAGLLLYVRDFYEPDQAEPFSALDSVWARLNLSGSGESAAVFLSLNLSAAAITETWNDIPLVLDEAFVRAFLGDVTIEGGLRKLTWGKADSLGPLDVINPLNYADLTAITDLKAMKIARPLVRLVWNTGDFSRLEGVFLPNFAGHRFAQRGRWTPRQITGIPSLAEQGFMRYASETWGSAMGLFPPAYIDGIKQGILSRLGDFSPEGPDTRGFEYFQGGLRFTATLGPADFGAQYFYGNDFRPGFILGGVDAFMADLIAGVTPQLPSPAYTGDPALIFPRIEYSRYHQIGLDYAQVVFGFNLRAEAAAHITRDLSGGDGAVKNPFLAWSFGFDRDLVFGINANLQLGETIRLLDSKVNRNPILDCEGDKDITATRLTARISRKFFNDNLECKFTGIWDIEEGGCYLLPSLGWTLNDARAELSAGVFAGREESELGHYWRSGFLRLALAYSF